MLTIVTIILDARVVMYSIPLGEPSESRLIVEVVVVDSNLSQTQTNWSYAAHHTTCKRLALIDWREYNILIESSLLHCIFVLWAISQLRGNTLM